MNRLIFFISAAILLAMGCKKDPDRVSQVVNVSFPTITVNGQSVTATSQDDYYTQTIGSDQIGFISITPGGSLAVSAYDSSLNESMEVKIEDDGGFDASVPGLYLIDYSARNKNGYRTLGRFYVAVTDVPSGTDLSGTYYSIMGTDTLSEQVEIDREANGLYLHNDVTGDELGIAGVFAHLSNNTIVFSEQPDLSGQLGSFSSSNGMVDTTGGVVTISYKLVNDDINDAYGDTTVFRFVRQ